MFEREAPRSLGLWATQVPPPAGHADLRALEIEFSSRGDRVPGRLLLPPEGEGPFPAVMLQHGLHGSATADYLTATGGPWARRGAAVLSIDFPLHGARSDPKLSQLVLGALTERRHGGARGEWIRELIGQAVADLGRAADALQELPGIDAKRLVYAGFSMGGVIGAIFCALDQRPRAAALAVAGAGLGAPGADAPEFVERIAPRPLLMVNTTRDEIFPRPKVEALFEAAAEPKQLLWFEGAHAELPGRGLKAMWEFLRPHLEL